MFTKIDVKKYGLYKDFTWGSLPELGRVNHIRSKLLWQNHAVENLRRHLAGAAP